MNEFTSRLRLAAKAPIDAANDNTLRDFIAANALPALILSADEDWRKENREECPTIDEYAIDAYRIADAMLAAQAERPMNRKQRHRNAMRICLPASVLRARLRDAWPWLLGLKQFRRLLRRKRERIGEYAT